MPEPRAPRTVSAEIAQRYVDRLAAQGIDDLTPATHETCMLARWDALMEWLDEQAAAAKVEAQLESGRGRAPATDFGFVRALGSEQAERERRVCERLLIGTIVRLQGFDWHVRVVNHLLGTADLAERSAHHRPDSPLVLKNVALEDVASAAGCSCGQHVKVVDRG